MHVLGDRTAISAFADDTLTHIKDGEDLKIALYTLSRAEKATAGKVNFKKSEAILTGKWRRNPPKDLEFKIVKCAKYLEAPVGDNKIAIDLMWEQILVRISKELDFWNLNAKVAASKSNWIAAHINKKLNKVSLMH